MKKLLLYLLVLGVVMYLTKPTQEQYYKKVLLEEADMGDKYFGELKYSVVDLAFEHEDYVVGGVMRSKVDHKIKYIGLFRTVIKIDKYESGK
jgi:hypothetical protein